MNLNLTSKLLESFISNKNFHDHVQKNSKIPANINKSTASIFLNLTVWNYALNPEMHTHARIHDGYSNHNEGDREKLSLFKKKKVFIRWRKENPNNIASMRKT